jgi:hypothetical protein
MSAEAGVYTIRKFRRFDSVDAVLQRLASERGDVARERMIEDGMRAHLDAGGPVVAVPRQAVALFGDDRASLQIHAALLWWLAQPAQRDAVVRTALDLVRRACEAYMVNDATALQQAVGDLNGIDGFTAIWREPDHPAFTDGARGDLLALVTELQEKDWQWLPEGAGEREPWLRFAAALRECGMEGGPEAADRILANLARAGTQGN